MLRQFFTASSFFSIFNFSSSPLSSAICEVNVADVAVFAGDRRGIIYVQGEKVANIPEEEILDRLLLECKLLEDRVRSGETNLGEKVVNIVAPALTIEGQHT